ncbi:hypothetical protein WJX72_008788 [[Myrmecia] bisecta]|uniref:mRNA (guanine-N(7))-methyltransferase n=1 Tax=[Myrmecia] bisecta TaxID=41462 RepID=A0AAW1PWT5_9CHLO
MDHRQLEATRSHYDQHSLQYATQEEAIQARQQGEALPLKNLHNTIKKLLINRFAGGKDSLLDLACGRGGDIWKWINAGIRYVKGVDLAPKEIEEAQIRFEEARRQRRDMQLAAEFLCTPELGRSLWSPEDPANGQQRLYDAVSCMFALHYFFETEASLHMFMRNVSRNLKDGGYFFGCVPDGRTVVSVLMDEKRVHGRDVYDHKMLRLEALWQGQAQSFGTKYLCAIGDTVTAGHEKSKGSVEFLVFKSTLIGVAAQHGLKPVMHYHYPELERLLSPADCREDQPGFLKHFNPKFPPESDASLAVASALNATFVFQKTSAKEGQAPQPAGQHQHHSQSYAGQKRQRDGSRDPYKQPSAPQAANAQRQDDQAPGSRTAPEEGVESDIIFSGPMKSEI